MHSSVGIGQAPPHLARELASDLRLVQARGRSGATGHFRGAVVAFEVLADLVTIVVSVLLSYAVYSYLSLGRRLHYPTQAVLVLAIAFAVVMILMLDRVGAYRRANSLLRVRETEQVLQVSAQAFLIALAISFVSSVLFSRWVLALCLTIVPLALFIEKSLMYLLVRALQQPSPVFPDVHPVSRPLDAPDDVPVVEAVAPAHRVAAEIQDQRLQNERRQHQVEKIGADIDAYGGGEALGVADRIEQQERGHQQ